MKIRNVSLDHGYARTRGWVGPDAAAATGLISIGSDIPPIGGPFTKIAFPGQLVEDQGGGLASIDVRAIIGELVNDSGSDLVAGTVGVIDTSSGEFVLTTTARDNRPAGVVVAPIATGATGFVQFSGFAPVVNVVSSVTAGDYGETSTTAGDAQGSGTTRESGSFCIFTSTGTTPSAYLWGMTDATTGSGSGGSGSGVSRWFNVRDYGATGDGATDDRAAINLAIAALVTQGQGVLYFPAGWYKVSGALTALSVPTWVLGDGMANFDGTSGGNSIIQCTSTTAALFTASGDVVTFQGIACLNSTAVSAGAAIVASPTTGLERYNIDACSFQGFYDNIDMQGTGWSLRASWSSGAKRYGLRVRNTVIVDAGDWAISDCGFFANTYDSDAAIRIETSGGGKVVNTKVNSSLDGKKWNHGIDLAVTSSTSVLLVANSSFENIRGDGIHGTTAAGTKRYAFVQVANNQFGLYSNNSGSAVSFNSTTAGDFNGCLITGNTFHTDGTARAAVALTNCSNTLIGSNVLSGNFTSYFTDSGSTATRDFTGGIADGVAVTGTPTFGQIPIASSGTAAVWGSGTHYEILMASGSADPLLTSDGLDYLYVEVPN